MIEQRGWILRALYWKKKANFKGHIYLILFIKHFFFFFVFSRASPAANVGSQARGRIRAVAAGLRHSSDQRRIWASSATNTTAHSNAGSLTHWERPGMEPASLMDASQIRVCWATTGTPAFTFLVNDFRRVLDLWKSCEAIFTDRQCIMNCLNTASSMSLTLSFPTVYIWHLHGTSVTTKEPKIM